MSGEQGTESTSLVVSSAEDVSDRRENSRGGRLPDKVRTRGEPQCSSQPLSTVWADFCNTPRRSSREEAGRKQLDGHQVTSKGSMFLSEGEVVNSK